MKLKPTGLWRRLVKSTHVSTGRPSGAQRPTDLDGGQRSRQIKRLVTLNWAVQQGRQGRGPSGSGLLWPRLCGGVQVHGKIHVHWIFLHFAGTQSAAPLLFLLLCTWGGGGHTPFVLPPVSAKGKLLSREAVASQGTFHIPGTWERACWAARPSSSVRAASPEDPGRPFWESREREEGAQGQARKRESPFHGQIPASVRLPPCLTQAEEEVGSQLCRDKLD